MPDRVATTADRRPFTPTEVRRALSTSMVAWGLFGSAWSAMVSGTVYVTFVREKLHASTFAYAAIMSLPFFAVVAQLLGSYLTETLRRRRRQCLLATTGSRSLWFVVAALPWLIPSHLPGVRLGVLVGVMLTASLLSHISNPAGFSWFADIVPESIRARYLANRAALSTTTMVVASALVSWIIDHHTSFLTFAVIFSIAGVLGLADIWYYALRVREAPMAPHEGPPWHWFDAFVIPLANRPFRRYLLYTFSETFMNGLVGPFWWLMALEVLHIGAFWANMYVMVMPMVFMAVALPFWGRVADRTAARKLVTIGTLGNLIYPVLWVLATPRAFHPFLLISALVGGSLWAAAQTADMAMMYSLTPRENRSAYMACLMLAANLGFGVSQLTGGRIAQSLERVHLYVAGFTFGNIHLLMLLSIVLILSHVLLIIPRLPTTVEDPAPAAIPSLEPALEQEAD